VSEGSPVARFGFSSLPLPAARAPLNFCLATYIQPHTTTALAQSRWLLVNVQGSSEFASHRLNRDTWSEPLVQDMLTGTFVFWQVGLGLVVGWVGWGGLVGWGGWLGGWGGLGC